MNGALDIASHDRFETTISLAIFLPLEGLPCHSRIASILDAKITLISPSSKSLSRQIGTHAAPSAPLSLINTINV